MRAYLTVTFFCLLFSLLAPPPIFGQCVCCEDPSLECGPNAYFDLCECTCVAYQSPIIVDTSGEGFKLTSAANGVLFDMSGSGSPMRLAWTAAGSSNAFLVLDRNGNGTVDNGTELFGNFTPQPQSATPNGFLALAEYDKPQNGGNSDGIIESRDAIFGALRLWIDSDHNGISGPHELFPLAVLAIKSVSLDYRESRRTDEFGNIFRYRAKMSTDENGSAGPWACDVFLRLEK